MLISLAKNTIPMKATAVRRQGKNLICSFLFFFSCSASKKPVIAFHVPVQHVFHIYVSVGTSWPVNPRKQNRLQLNCLMRRLPFVLSLKISISILMNLTESNEPHRRIASSSMIWSDEKIVNSSS